MSFINFNNKSELYAGKYSARVIAEALYSVETKNTKKIEATLSSVKEPVAISEALKFFSNKINALSALQVAKTNALPVNEGQFSWMTQDTGEQIGSEKENRITVYMYDNEGNQWKEDKYDGYGEFGGMDYYELLAKMNGYSEEDLEEVKGPFKEMRQLGIDLAFGKLKTKDKGRKVLFPALVEDPRYNWKRHNFTQEPESDPNQSWYVEPDYDNEYDDEYYEAKTNEEDLNERSINKIQKDWAKVTADMKTTVDAWKSAEGAEKEKMLAKLKELTAKKKSLEAELDAAVGLKDADAELVGEAAAPGEWVTFIELKGRGNKLHKVHKSHRASTMALNKLERTELTKDDVQSVGQMTKKEWDRDEAPYAVKERNVTWDDLINMINEAKFYRIDPKVRDNELYRSYLDIKSFYESLTNGNDVDLKVLDSIIKNLQKVKKSIKGFNSSDEVMGTVYETVSPINEATMQEIDKKVQKFVIKNANDYDYSNQDSAFQIYLSLKKLYPNLIKEAVNEGVSKIACLECDEVNTKAAWKKNNGICPACNDSTQGVAEMVKNESVVTEEEDYSDEMSYGQLESCIDNSNMIRDRIKQGVSLDPWMHSQIAVAKNELTSVFDALDGDDGVVETVTNEAKISKMSTEHLKKMIKQAEDERVSPSFAMQIKAARAELKKRGESMVESSAVTEAKTLDRDEMMIWLEDHLDFIRTTEEFDGAQGGIWVSGENGDMYKGKRIYDYYNEDSRKYSLGVLTAWEKELNKRGWYSEWYDAGTVMIWPN